MPSIDFRISRGWRDVVNRLHADRLLIFLNRFDVNNSRVQCIEHLIDENGYLASITMVTASGERYVRPFIKSKYAGYC